MRENVGHRNRATWLLLLYRCTVIPGAVLTSPGPAALPALAGFQDMRGRALCGAQGRSFALMCQGGLV